MPGGPSGLEVLRLKLPKVPTKPSSFETQVRAIIVNMLELKSAGYTDIQVLEAFDRGMTKGKAKADAAPTRVS